MTPVSHSNYFHDRFSTLLFYNCRSRRDEKRGVEEERMILERGREGEVEKRRGEEVERRKVGE